MNPIEATVTIRRPLAEVFAFYRDFTNLPRFLGDVTEIERTGPKTYRWTIAGPLGVEGHWTVRITEERLNELIRYETTTPSPVRTEWEIHFARGTKPGETIVREVMRVPLGIVGRAALALIGRHPTDEVPANLHRLQELLETGKVTDRTHAVAGKFDRP